ncbi:hydroxymethylglutaryl-CoA lyase [Peptoniphilus equinus]|uniref:Hydroxymethylglutaryl-CoA lyase n=1 Tax=Peptoniphilus equinus TaxID=3016343 RepID=A0ABY7QTC7_9FIRM|nr:hydroxymethylglutaryl-CoA lyase [Peptoniphilus equinus]WBW50046.1 hydroxymethylglutaryl-CoA lyase [Peptoniphilus equinus]
MMNIDKVTLCEVGLRDGFQNEQQIFSTEDKITILDMLTDAGYPIIEVGSFMSPKAVPQMADTDAVYKQARLRDGVEYRALIANLRGVQRAIDCGCKKVKLNVSASKAHNIANLNMTPQESVAGFKACVDLAHDHHIEVSGSISMPFGSPWEDEIPLTDIETIVQAYLNLDVKELSLSDASGLAYPSQVKEIVTAMKAQFPEVKWILHFHNTRGLGIANIVAGMEAGVDTFDTSFAGLGGCPFVPGAAGNVSSEDVLNLMNQMHIDTGIDLDKVIEIGRFIRDRVQHDVHSYVLKAGKSVGLKLELPQKKVK